MSATAEPANAVLRLRIALRDIKPAPWRRVEVLAATTLADLHRVIQMAMGWDDAHLHCFHILGRCHDDEYHDLARIRLSDFRLRAGERFLYTYNHFVPWDHELRVEAIVPRKARRRYPHCLTGRHPCPPEWCSGPEALDQIRGDLLGLGFYEDLDVMVAFSRALLDAREEGTLRDVIDAVGEDELRRSIDRQKRRDELLAPFDRHRANTALAELGRSTEEAMS